MQFPTTKRQLTPPQLIGRTTAACRGPKHVLGKSLKTKTPRQIIMSITMVVHFIRELTLIQRPRPALYSKVSLHKKAAAMRSFTLAISVKLEDPASEQLYVNAAAARADADKRKTEQCSLGKVSSSHHDTITQERESNQTDSTE